VTPATTLVLLGTAAGTAAFHTLIPDHWLPFVLIGRARGWSLRRTAGVSALSALIHTSLSALLGGLALALGLETARALGHRLEEVSGLLLVAFGVVYAVWAATKGGHFHPGGRRVHGAEDLDACGGEEGDSGSDHFHYHADVGLIQGRSRRSDAYLAAIIGLNPCILVLPIFLATAEKGPWVVAAVAAAYTLTTVALMVGLSVAGMAGARSLRLGAAARYLESASGILIALLGALLWLVE